MSKVKDQKLKVQKGFTVLETIVSIAIVSLAIAGATSAVRTGIIGSSIAKEQVKAFYFAQEAIEIIRNIRDANALDRFNGGTNNWLTGIALSGDPCEQGNTCIVDPVPGNPSDPPTLVVCSGGWNSCPYLRQNLNTFLYGYNAGWTQTPFRREVQIERVTDDEYSITVQVSWNHGTLNRSFKTKAILMNWF